MPSRRERVLVTPEKATACSGAMRDGLKVAWPICVGYVPIGLAFGVLGQKAGLAPWQIGLMSLLVFAGSSQFIGVAMISAGAGGGAIIGTTFLVNLRHVLMSSALARHLDGAEKKFLALFAYGVTDESFAVNAARFHDGDWDRWRALIVNHAANACWIASTIVGGYVGEFVPSGAFGIDYALTAMFLCLLVYQLRERLHFLIAVISGGLSVAFHGVMPKNANVMAATIAAATVGLLIAQRMKKEER